MATKPKKKPKNVQRNKPGIITAPIPEQQPVLCIESGCGLPMTLQADGKIYMCKGGHYQFNMGNI